jgi:hypothetical protein
MLPDPPEADVTRRTTCRDPAAFDAETLHRSQEVWPYVNEGGLLSREDAVAASRLLGAVVTES